MQDLILSAAAHPVFPGGLQRIGLPVVGAICAALALLLMVKRKPWRRIQAGLMFIAGLALAGVGGLVRDWIEHVLTKSSASVSQWAFGIAVPALAAIILAFWLYLDMDFDGLFNKARGKTGATNRHTTNAFTPWLALIVPGVVTTVPFLTDLPHAITQALS